MLGKVKAIIDRLNTQSAAGVADAWPDEYTSISEPDGPADGNSVDGPPTHLYRCPSCDRVFVATDKQTCSQCDTAVDRVE